MTDDRPHPDYLIALDRSRPIEERKLAYRRWADEHQPHIHPGLTRHAHAGGDDPFHNHEEKP
jgi:hypothetical protein